MTVLLSEGMLPEEHNMATPLRYFPRFSNACDPTICVRFRVMCTGVPVVIQWLHRPGTCAKSKRTSACTNRSVKL